MQNRRSLGARIFAASFLVLCVAVLLAIGYWTTLVQDGCWNKERVVEIPLRMEKISLEAMVRDTESGTFVLHYVVKNEERGDVGLFVGFHKDPGVGAYLDVEGEVLHVRKTLLDRPSTGRFDDWFKPGELIVHPGQRYEEDIVLPPRVEVDNPARRTMRISANPAARGPKATRAVQVTRIVLQVGAFYVRPEMVPRPDSLAPPGYVATGATHADQAIVEMTVVLPRPLTVLDYD